MKLLIGLVLPFYGLPARDDFPWENSVSVVYESFYAPAMGGGMIKIPLVAMESGREHVINTQVT